MSNFALMGERVTATFLFTDLVGSTELRSALGDDEADTVHDRCQRLIGDLVTFSGGQVVKWMGDGAMAVFSSAADAIASAMAIQEGFTADNESERGLAVRIGINSGEVSHQDGDYAGLPVIVASRLCDLASGGEILTSGVVTSLVGSRGGFGFVPLGRRALKGIEHPVEVWRVGEGAEPAGARLEEATIPFPPMLERQASARLVGRDRISGELDRALGKAREGTRQTVLLAGEPGIGKSALAAVWARGALAEGCAVVAGRCPAEAVTSYQPFIEVIRQVVDFRPGLVQGIPGAGELARLIPDLVGRLSLPVPSQGDPGTQRYVLFEGFVSLIHRLAEESPLILVVDDLHWADAASLSLFEHVCSHHRQAPVLILGTYRDTDLTRAHPLSRVLGELRRERRFQRLELKGLDRDQVGEVVALRAGGQASDRTVAEIYAETEGNPFFVEEVVAHLLDVGAVDPSGEWKSDSAIDGLGIPEGVREVIGRRLEQLDETTDRMLTIAAVVGRDFDLELLEAVSGEGLETVEDRMESAIGTGLVVDTGGGRFTFSHALIRQTLYEEMSSTRRARLHRKVAEALVEKGASAGELAHHWSGANDLPRALRASIEAAAAAGETFAFDASRRHLDLALELWDEVGDAEEAAGIDLAELYHRAAEIYYLTEGGARPVELIDRAIALVDPAAAPLRAGVLHTRRAGFLWWQGESEAAQAAAEEATRLIPRQPPSTELARALAMLARLSYLAGRPDEAQENAQEAIAVARQVGDGGTEGHALNTLGSVRGDIGEIEAGVGDLQAAKRIAEEENELDDQLRAYNNLSVALIRAGRLQEAAEEAKAGYTIAARFGAGPIGAFTLNVAASALVHLGEWDEAEELMSLEPLEEMGGPASILTQRALLAGRRGDFATAHRVTETMLGRTRHSTDPQDIALARFCTAELALWEERWAEALAHADEGLKLVVGSREAWFTAWLAPVGLRGLARLAGEAEENPEAMEAGRRLAQSAEKAAAVALPHISANAATSEALLAGIRGTPDPDLWEEAARRWEALPMPFEAAWARADHAETLIRLGRADEAPPLLDRAEETVQRLRARPLAERIDRLRNRHR